MRIILFLIVVLSIAPMSCSPGPTMPATVINSATPHFKVLQTSSPKSTMTILPAEGETPSSTATPRAFESRVSPNGELVANAYFETEHPSGKQTIEIVNKEGKRLWQIPFQGEMPNSDPRPLLVIYQWSNDSSQLYFYYVWSPDGGDRALWWTGHDLQKIDVKTGEIQPVLPTKSLMSFTISPNGTQIVYIREQDQPRIIYLRDLTTGKEKAVYVVFGPQKYVRAGNIHWSPSGKKVVFQTETEDYRVQTILLNPTTMKQRIIKQYGLFTLLLDGWRRDGKLQFSEISADGMRMDNVYQIDADTAELTVIGTPTSQP